MALMKCVHGDIEVSGNQRNIVWIGFIPTNESGSYVSSRTAQSTDMTTPRTEAVTPARRVVVVRNTKNPQSVQGSVDLGELGRSKSDENPPVITDGNKSVYVIRRPIGSESSSRPPPPPPPAELYRTVPEPIPTTHLQHVRTPTPPNETAISLDQPRSPSPYHSPSIRSKGYKPNTTPPIQTEKSSDYVPYLRRPRSKVRKSCAPPVQTTSYKRSTSPTQAEHFSGFVPYLRRSRIRTPSPTPIRTSQAENFQGFIPYLKRSTLKSRAPSAHHTNSARPLTVKEDEIDDVNHQRSFTYYSLQNRNEYDEYIKSYDD
ncbi:unnamed protein product [Rotaria socialis]|nr:unnamed protein product [Rotaria socialis]CAF4390175.1 unnamed protein product [Rotaria socialis]